ncbi:MAG: hypothetical protein AAF738_06940 [Bacteroidota bacterium]
MRPKEYEVTNLVMVKKDVIASIEIGAPSKKNLLAFSFLLPTKALQYEIEKSIKLGESS